MKDVPARASLEYLPRQLFSARMSHANPQIKAPPSRILSSSLGREPSSFPRGRVESLPVNGVEAIRCSGFDVVTGLDDLKFLRIEGKTTLLIASGNVLEPTEFGADDHRVRFMSETKPDRGDWAQGIGRVDTQTSSAAGGHCVHVTQLCLGIPGHRYTQSTLGYNGIRATEERG